MDLILKRNEYRHDGVFGEITDRKGNFLVMTLEHSYDKLPKIPAGEYVCVKGTHRLSDLKPFTTFEITGVQGHSGLVFHLGNYNEDSDGCVLVGSAIGYKLDGGKMLTASKLAFAGFMAMQKGCDSFKLWVRDNQAAFMKDSTNEPTA